MTTTKWCAPPTSLRAGRAHPTKWIPAFCDKRMDCGNDPPSHFVLWRAGKPRRSTTSLRSRQSNRDSQQNGFPLPSTSSGQVRGNIFCELHRRRIFCFFPFSAKQISNSGSAGCAAGHELPRFVFCGIIDRFYGMREFFS